MNHNQNSLDSRLQSLVERKVNWVFSNSEEVTFDNDVKDRLLDIARNERGRALVDNVRHYLNRLRDSSGVPFGRSIRQKESLDQAFNGFFEPEPAYFGWNRNYRAALKAVDEMLFDRKRLSPIRPTSDADVVSLLSEWNTSSGMDGIIYQKSKKVDFKDGIFTMLEMEIARAMEEGIDKIYLPSVRTQCSGEYDSDGKETNTCKHKTRLVWDSPLFLVLIEAMFVNPLIEYLSQHEYLAIGESDEATLAWVNELRFKGWGNDTVYSLDFSQYDATLPSWIIKDVMSMWKSHLDLTDEEDKLFEAMVKQVTNRKLFYDGKVYTITRGLGSGEKFTNLLDSCAGLVMQMTAFYAWSEQHSMPVDARMKFKIQGDDQNIITNLPLRMEWWCSYLSRNFGLTANAEKCVITKLKDHFWFCQRDWTGEAPRRNVKLVLSRAMFPEHWRPYKRVPELTPDLILYSYFLAYGKDLGQYFDWRKLDLGIDLWKVASVKAAKDALPWNVRQALEAYGVRNNGNSRGVKRKIHKPCSYYLQLKSDLIAGVR